MRRPPPHTLRPGQESVWDYPRPPRLEPERRRVRVVHAGLTVADTARALRVLETSHPPTYYLPPEDLRGDLLKPGGRTSWCEWKGRAEYLDLQVGDETLASVAWRYPEPMRPFGALRDHVAFYAGRLDACLVGDERVVPQPGRFYGGWITSDVVGPFKGDAGSEGW